MLTQYVTQYVNTHDTFEWIVSFLPFTVECEFKNPGFFVLKFMQIGLGVVPSIWTGGVLKLVQRKRGSFGVKWAVRRLQRSCLKRRALQVPAQALLVGVR